MQAVGVIILALVIYLALREVNCWYFKINEMLKQQQETNRLLRKIAGEQDEPEQPAQEINENTPIDVEKYNKTRYGG